MTRARPRIVLLALAAAGLALGAVHAQAPVRVRMSTALPEGTAQYDAWKALEAAWRQASGGASELRVYGGGAGDAEMLQRLQAQQIQAALLTVDGAAQLEPGFAVLRVPLLADGPATLAKLLAAVAPELAARLERRGLVLLGFAPVGWVRLFAKQPLRSVEDARAATLADWRAEPAVAAWWKEQGYAMAPLALPEVAGALGAGTATVVPATPALALALEWYRPAPHLLDVPLAPALGVVVVDVRAWSALPETGRKAVRETVASLERASLDGLASDEAGALAAMAKRGLVVERPTPAQAEGWKREAARLRAAARGTLAPAELLDRAVAALRAPG